MSIKAELAFQVLRFCIQKLAEDDLKTLVGLGFTIEEIHRFKTLTLSELHHFNELSGLFLEIRINHPRLTKALDHIRRDQESEALQDELLRRRASLVMMRALFGTTPVQYANRRKLLGLAGSGVGRPTVPNEDTERRIWQGWRQHAPLSDGQRYLAVAEATGLPVNVVWTVIQAGEGENLSSCADHPVSIAGKNAEVAIDAQVLSALSHG